MPEPAASNEWKWFRSQYNDDFQSILLRCKKTLKFESTETCIDTLVKKCMRYKEDLIYSYQHGNDDYPHEWCWDQHDRYGMDPFACIGEPSKEELSCKGWIRSNIMNK